MFASLGKKITIGMALAASLVTVAPVVHATVHTQGAWPSDEKHVTVKIEGTRAQAVKKLANAAGWSVVLPASLREGEDDLDVDVTDQAPEDVLRAILTKGDFTATREGTMVTIAAGEAPVQSAVPAPPPVAAPPAVPDAKEATPPTPPPPPPPPPAPTARGEDRTVTGGKLRIGKDEVVHDVAVLGGSVEVLGTVTGDLAVMGGKANIAKDAHVFGDATAIGGTLEIADGARVDGDVGVVGGSLNRHEGSIVGGKVVGAGDGNVSINVSDGGHIDTKIQPQESEHKGRKKLAGTLERIGGGLTRAAMLFVFGVVVLALGASRMDKLKAEIAARPVKSFAIGVLGSLGAMGLTVILCITVIGIPFAVLFILLGVLAVYMGIVAVLTTAGAAVLGHRTKNPYIHLGAGCAAFFLIGAIPYVGGFVTALVTLAAIGSLVSTRVGGLVMRTRSVMNPMV